MNHYEIAWDGTRQHALPDCRPGELMPPRDSGEHPLWRPVGELVANPCRKRRPELPVCQCGCARRVMSTHARYLPGHSPTERGKQDTRRNHHARGVARRGE